MIISNDNDSLIFDMHIMMKMIPRYYHSIITQISIKYPNIKSQTNNILSRYFDKPQYCTLVSPVDINQEVNAIVNPVNDSEDIESPQDKPRNDESDIVDYDSQLDLNIDTKGPKINDKVAGVVNKLCLQRISQDQSKAMTKRHSTPQNVNLKLPKCEPSISNETPGKTRVNDIKFQSIQALLIASVNCQLEVAETLLKTKSEKQVITTCLDGITLAMASNYELNPTRRDALRPQFKSEFAKGLCSSTNPADEFLFGGDTAKRMKEIAELNKNKVCKAQPSRPQGRGQRFSPYPQRGFRGYIRGRGVEPFVAVALVPLAINSSSSISSMRPSQK